MWKDIYIDFVQILELRAFQEEKPEHNLSNFC